MKWRMEGTDRAGKRRTVVVHAADEQEAVNIAYKNGVTAETIVEAEEYVAPSAPTPPPLPFSTPRASKSSVAARWTSIPLLGKIAIIWITASVALLFLLALFALLARS